MSIIFTSISFKNSKECLLIWWALSGQVNLRWDLRWSRPTPNFWSRERDTASLWLGTVIGRSRTASTLWGSTWQEQKGGVWFILFLSGSGGWLCPAIVFKEAPGPSFTVCSNQKPYEEVESHHCSVSFCSRRGLGWLKSPGPFWFVNKLYLWFKKKNVS